MIPGFTPQTEPLNDYERDTLLPIICQGLRNKIGEARAVTNATIETQGF